MVKIKTNFYQYLHGKILPNLALLLPKSIQTPGIKSGYQCLLRDIV